MRTHQRDESFQYTPLKLKAPFASVIAVKTVLPSHLSATTRIVLTPRPFASTTVPKIPGSSPQLSAPRTRPRYLCVGADAPEVVGGRTTTDGAIGCVVPASAESGASRKYVRRISATTGAATSEPSPPPAMKTVTTTWGFSYGAKAVNHACVGR